MGSGFNLSILDDPVSTLFALNKIANEIDKVTRRPVACIANLRVNHPKIVEFIRCKNKENFFIWKFNISIEIT